MKLNEFAKLSGLSATGLLLSALPAFAQEAVEGAVEAATEAVPEIVAIVDKGDTAWMLTATVLVLAMILPGLALFYGGLVRAKNMLSILSQVLGITAVAILVWVCWGYTLAFDAGGSFIGGKFYFGWRPMPFTEYSRRQALTGMQLLAFLP